MRRWPWGRSSLAAARWAAPPVLFAQPRLRPGRARRPLRPGSAAPRPLPPLPRLGAAHPRRVGLPDRSPSPLLRASPLRLVAPQSGLGSGRAPPGVAGPPPRLWRVACRPARGRPVPPRRPVSGLRSLSGGGCAACGPRPGRRCRPPERGRRLPPAAFVWLLWSSQAPPWPPPRPCRPPLGGSRGARALSGAAAPTPFGRGPPGAPVQPIPCCPVRLPPHFTRRSRLKPGAPLRVRP